MRKDLVDEVTWLLRLKAHAERKARLAARKDAKDATPAEPMTAAD